MPRYFFDLNDGVETANRNGAELPDDAAAMREAKRLTLAYATTPLLLGNDGGVFIVTARDEAGASVATVRLVMSVEAA